MRWTPGGRSENVEDRRGTRMRAGAGIGLGGLLILGLLTLVTGRNFLSLAPLLESQGPTVQQEEGPIQSSPEEEKRVQFVSFVLDDAQNTWKQILGPRYHDTKLVLFRDATETGCGFGRAATGPFYCPVDEKVYIDLGFYDELQQRFGATGEFAQAYVLAHEIGHHVQKQAGIERAVREQQSAHPGEANELSVRLELQADCFAGVWGHSTARRDLLDPGDVDEGLAAAAAVGDDRIQEMATGDVHPESFTHGSSQQRAEWFRRGFESGDPKFCDTFGTSD